MKEHMSVTLYRMRNSRQKQTTSFQNNFISEIARLKTPFVISGHRRSFRFRFIYVIIVHSIKTVASHRKGLVSEWNRQRRKKKTEK